MKAIQPGDVFLGNQTDNLYYVFSLPKEPFFSFIRLSTTREPIIDTWESLEGFDVSIKEINEYYERRIMKGIFIAEFKDRKLN